MTKLTYALAAVAALSIAAPTIASAQGVGVYIGGDRDYYGHRYDGPRVYRDYDRGWHHGWYNHHRDYYRDRGFVVRGHDWDD
ncbi:hypothetical protein [Bradyrhizobium uaiense]|uniref:Uncharacterized protein n=1 Tax=Bradyrhizobium uaiense TaxID=2594946 RepID=A0A6P1BQT3_9BRAD|nr:hypothetical protein [Bradyrhizobium uaiense]NEV00689.1 hypothetical protein [Bradyrhizobium uaiense]